MIELEKEPLQSPAITVGIADVVGAVEATIALVTNAANASCVAAELAAEIYQTELASNCAEPTKARDLLLREMEAKAKGQLLAQTMCLQ